MSKHYLCGKYIQFITKLTHWGRVTHICVGNLTIIGSDNGLSPDRRQAITWTNVGILLIGPLGTNFSEMLIEIRTFSFKKIHLKMSSGKCRPFCLGLNVFMLSPPMSGRGGGGGGLVHGLTLLALEWGISITLRWRHNGCDSVSNHRPHVCLLYRLFRRRYQRKHQSSASLAFVRGIHRVPVNSPHKWPVTRKMFPFDDVIMSDQVTRMRKSVPCHHVVMVTILAVPQARQ